jgi:hypothetical protein
MRLLRNYGGESKRFAVYLQCGSNSKHKEWLTDDSPPWSLIVNHYENTFVGEIPCELEFQQVGQLPGTKVTSFRTLMQRWPDLLIGYDYILLLDDDVYIRALDVGRLFHLAEMNGLDLAQPSLSYGSAMSHDVFRTRPGNQLRFVNGVEIMMPLLSRRALTAAAQVFEDSISGWGLDLATGKLVGEQFGTRAAVFDTVIAEHRKPIDPVSGGLYKMLLKEHIYPRLEYHYIVEKYGADRIFYEIDCGDCQSAQV